MTLHLLIRGRVQGVYFRASAKEVADKLGVNGWVRNTPQGDVEAVASGNEAAVEAFVTWCRQGPPAAVVASVEAVPTTESVAMGFAIRR